MAAELDPIRDFDELPGAMLLPDVIVRQMLGLSEAAVWRLRQRRPDLRPLRVAGRNRTRVATLRAFLAEGEARPEPEPPAPATADVVKLPKGQRGKPRSAENRP